MARVYLGHWRWLEAQGPSYKHQAASCKRQAASLTRKHYNDIGLSYHPFAGVRCKTQTSRKKDNMIDNKDYTRRNRFNGESVELTAEEADKHDKIFYHEALATLEDEKLGTGASKHWQEMRKLLTWFQKNNAKAYMVLLD